MDSIQLNLFFVGLYAYLGKEINLAWREFKLEWRKWNHYPTHCFKCGIKVKKSGPTKSRTANVMTLDHIIPRSMLEELELVELLFDRDNFQLLCYKCNQEKLNYLPDIESLDSILVAKFYTAIDRRNKELAVNE